MPRPLRLEGMRFGRLSVIKKGTNTPTGKSRWICICDCGNECVVTGSDLASGHTKSCGCGRVDRLVKAAYSTTHGESKTRLYHIWYSMRQRCYYIKHKSYREYGGRGITVCDEWRDSFEAFRDWALSHGYSDTLTIDRINNDGNYCPENCRWVNTKQQVRNRRNTRTITYRGQIKSIAEWSEITGISAPAIIQRINAGWSPERTLETPYKERKKPCN